MPDRHHRRDPPTFDGDTGGLERDAPWPMLGRGPTRQARSAIVAGPTRSTPSWARPFAEMKSPTIGANGSIYVTSGDGMLNALDRDGMPRWTYPVSSGFGATIGQDAVYAGGEKLVALDPMNGAPKWEHRFGTDAVGLPTVGGDGTIYVTVADGYLYAIDPRAPPVMMKWRRRIGAPAVPDTQPAIAPDGTIYVCETPSPTPHLHHLHALSSTTGAIRWSAPLTGDCDAPSIAIDGTIYVGTRNGDLHAIRPDGALRWIKQVGPIAIGFDAVPVIGADGTVYVAAWTLGVIALRGIDGEPRWTESFPNGGVSGIAIGGDGVLYVGTWDPGTVRALSPLGHELWKHEIIGANGCFAAPAIGADGTVYIGCTDRRLYAFSP